MEAEKLGGEHVKKWLHWLKSKLVYILLALIFALIAAVIYLWARPNTTVITTKVAQFGLRDIGELSTQAGYCTVVQTIYKSREVFGVEVPGTSSNYVYSYDAVLKAGIDFAQVDVQVDDEAHTISVTLPEVQIFSIDIDMDSFVLYNDGSNMFTSLTMADINTSLSELKDKAREAALKNGIMEHARGNAELLIKGFMASTYDLNEYTISFS